ncbi:hypothetical protein LUZ60_007493 [Juncus effusus]|nr:hypothetical protein LUZ60_007493 [Juncus effusus]
MASYSSSQKNFPHFLSFFLILIISCEGAPTDGFTEVTLTEKDFDVQRPYDVPIAERYSFENGVRKLWVYSDDKPFNTETKTAPRTEIRMRNHDYSSGIWQFEGYGSVPNGTTNVSIMQVFSASSGPALMLRVYNDGELWCFQGKLIEDDIYNRWFQLNVIHNVHNNKITIFIDGVSKYALDDNNGGDYYFKFGVYTQNHSSYYMESRWKDVKIFNKTEV